MLSRELLTSTYCDGHNPAHQQQSTGLSLLSLVEDAKYTWNQLPKGWKHSPTICHGLIQTVLEQDEALEHLQYIDNIIVWGNTVEVFEKGKIVQIL
ncbi:endogenous retrovirus group k member 25 pol [Limosa lapponica baueri]|uniref:Endogenous retrovirus group k member 25 pol n=1 Tax=Limosa lapponica baueri TaxID=1758121 RepID=A0A2I0T412_LIMLA|nr:endogenous retrovirus group k member 25 pol [Limosa lapponica baueri]